MEKSMKPGCQMVYFQTENPNEGKIWRFLQLKMMVHFTTVWSILPLFGIFYGHLVHFSRFGRYAVLSKIWQPWYEDVFEVGWGHHESVGGGV
jgi:hypothetical protein